MLISCPAVCTQLRTSAGAARLRSLSATEPWTSPSTAWLNKPHTVISEPLSCGIALDTLLYMCLHIAFTYWMVWLWFAGWPASISVRSFCTDQIASLMAWDDDTGRNVFQHCSKTTSSEKTITWSWHQTTCLVKHDFSPLTTQTARAKGAGEVPVVQSPFFYVTGCIWLLSVRSICIELRCFGCRARCGLGLWNTRETMVK